MEKEGAAIVVPFVESGKYMEKETDIRQLKGVGEKTATLFSKLYIKNLKDLLEYYPRDYEQIGVIVPIAKTQIGQMCAVSGTIVQITADMPSVKGGRRLSILKVTIKDETGIFNLTFFNMPYLKNTLKIGNCYVFRGMIRDRGIKRGMEQPKVYGIEEFEKIANTMQPVYTLTEGISNQLMKKTISQALAIKADFEDYLSEELKKKYGLEAYDFCIRQIHFPESTEHFMRARKRLVFDEFLIFMIQLQTMKEQNAVMPNQNPMKRTKHTKRLLESLPYELTFAQKRVWEEVERDLGGKLMMNRLVQGDVGSGKTIVAFLALLMCAANGMQGAMMAPTEVLAKQHFQQAEEITKQYQLDFRPVLLTGSTSTAARREIYQKIESGEANLIIGTHALIQEKVQYHNLALVVTDEQHRFGVRQREAFASKGKGVHILVMSATPIPRTLAIILYGDLSISVIDELPSNRLPIKNCVVNQAYRKKAYQFMEKEVQAGRQIYIICPMVDEGELENVENVVEYREKLREMMSSTVRISSLYGSMKPAEKNQIMEDFAAHKIDILVSTTVIEVGINVPNATVIMVENAERFGLAQLHQLRGRVGRGKQQSYCIFVSGSENKRTMERLSILNKSNDGFYIAGEDLKQRGPGDLFGIRQSGLMEFRLGDIFSDASILKEAGECAKLAIDNKLFEKDRLTFIL